MKTKKLKISGKTYVIKKETMGWTVKEKYKRQILFTGETEQSAIDWITVWGW